MKTKILYTLFALSLLAISCQKSDYCDDINEIDDAIVITASYKHLETKTTLSNDDYLTPLWSVGDQIWVSDGINDKTITLAASGTALSDNNGVISADSKSFQFTSPSSSASSTIYAVYPASCAKKAVSEGKISINIPSVQAGTFASANICAAQGVMNISFKNVVSILKVTQADDANDYMWYNVGQPVAGDFSVNIDGTLSDAYNTSNLICGTISGEIGYYALAPVTPTENQTLTLKKSAETLVAAKTISNVSSYERNYFYKVVAPETGYEGMFTVDSEGKKVKFSLGNLYYNTSTNNYYFESNQYDFRHYPGITNDVAVINGITATTPSGTVGSFFWSKTASVAYAEAYSDPDATTSDVFFTNSEATTPNSSFTVEGQTGIWRTLSGGSGGEWEWLLGPSSNPNPGTNCRTCTTSGIGDNTNVRFAMVIVNSLKGMLIFPDTFCWNSSVMGFAPSKVNTCIPNELNVYSIAQFSAMEQAGCVFLPMASFRTNNVFSVANTYYLKYWASSNTNDTTKPSFGDYVNVLIRTSANGFFISGSFGSSSGYSRYAGLCVRLVCDPSCSPSSLSTNTQPYNREDL